MSVRKRRSEQLDNPSLTHVQLTMQAKRICVAEIIQVTSLQPGLTPLEPP